MLLNLLKPLFSPSKYKPLPQQNNLEHYKINLLHGQIKATSSKERVGYAKLEWRWVIKEKVAVQGSFIF